MRSMSAPSRTSMNGPCPCGSGVKYGKCCLPKDGTARVDDHRGGSLSVEGEPSPEALDLAADQSEQNEAGEGFAAQVMRFSQPLIDGAGDDPETLRRAITLGMIFWNMATLEDGPEEMLKGVLKDLALTQEQAAEFSALAADMVERHEEMFPELHAGRKGRGGVTKG